MQTRCENDVVWGSQEHSVPRAQQVKFSLRMMVWGGITARGHDVYAMACKQVAKLQRASLRDPVKVEVCNKYQTVDKLLQFYLFIPAREKVPLFILWLFFSL